MPTNKADEKLRVAKANRVHALVESVRNHPPEDTATKLAWCLLIVSCLTQIPTEASFPSYNPVIGVWALITIFTRRLGSCRALCWFMSLSVLLDIIFCTIWGTNGLDIFSSAVTRFGLGMFAINLILKLLSLLVFSRLQVIIAEDLLSNGMSIYAERDNRRKRMQLALDADAKYNIASQASCRVDSQEEDYYEEWNRSESEKALKSPLGSDEDSFYTMSPPFTAGCKSTEL